MKIYIAGPITGRSLDEARDEFARAANLLVSLGHDPVNPFVVAPTRDDWQWEDYMRADLTALLGCDAVATLSGHHQSRGARIEVDLAKRLGMPVHDIATWVFFPADRSEGTA